MSRAATSTTTTSTEGELTVNNTVRQDMEKRGYGLSEYTGVVKKIIEEKAAEEETKHYEGIKKIWSQSFTEIVRPLKEVYELEISNAEGIKTEIAKVEEKFFNFLEEVGILNLVGGTAEDFFRTIEADPLNLDDQQILEIKKRLELSTGRIRLLSEQALVSKKDVADDADIPAIKKKLKEVRAEVVDSSTEALKEARIAVLKQQLTKRRIETTDERIKILAEWRASAEVYDASSMITLLSGTGVEADQKTESEPYNAKASENMPLIEGIVRLAEIAERMQLIRYLLGELVVGEEVGEEVVEEWREKYSNNGSFSFGHVNINFADAKTISEERTDEFDRLQRELQEFSARVSADILRDAAAAADADADADAEADAEATTLVDSYLAIRRMAEAGNNYRGMTELDGAIQYLQKRNILKMERSFLHDPNYNVNLLKQEVQESLSSEEILLQSAKQGKLSELEGEKESVSLEIDEFLVEDYASTELDRCRREVEESGKKSRVLQVRIDMEKESPTIVKIIKEDRSKRIKNIRSTVKTMWEDDRFPKGSLLTNLRNIDEGQYKEEPNIVVPVTVGSAEDLRMLLSEYFSQPASIIEVSDPRDTTRKISAVVVPLGAHTIKSDSNVTAFILNAKQVRRDKIERVTHNPTDFGGRGASMVASLFGITPIVLGAVGWTCMRIAKPISWLAKVSEKLTPVGACFSITASAINAVSETMLRGASTTWKAIGNPGSYAGTFKRWADNIRDEEKERLTSMDTWYRKAMRAIHGTVAFAVGLVGMVLSVVASPLHIIADPFLNLGQNLRQKAKSRDVDFVTATLYNFGSTIVSTIGGVFKFCGGVVAGISDPFLKLGEYQGIPRPVSVTASGVKGNFEKFSNFISSIPGRLSKFSKTVLVEEAQMLIAERGVVVNNKGEGNQFFNKSLKGESTLAKWLRDNEVYAESSGRKADIPDIGTIKQMVQNVAKFIPISSKNIGVPIEIDGRRTVCNKLFEFETGGEDSRKFTVALSESGEAILLDRNNRRLVDDEGNMDDARKQQFCRAFYKQVQVVAGGGVAQVGISFEELSAVTGEELFKQLQKFKPITQEMLTLDKKFAMVPITDGESSFVVRIPVTASVSRSREVGDKFIVKFDNSGDSAIQIKSAGEGNHQLRDVVTQHTHKIEDISMKFVAICRAKSSEIEVAEKARREEGRKGPRPRDRVKPVGASAVVELRGHNR